MTNQFDISLSPFNNKRVIVIDKLNFNPSAGTREAYGVTRGSRDVGYVRLRDGVLRAESYIEGRGYVFDFDNYCKDCFSTAKEREKFIRDIAAFFNHRIKGRIRQLPRTAFPER